MENLDLFRRRGQASILFIQQIITHEIQLEVTASLHSIVGP